MSQTNHLTEAELRQRLAEVEAILAALRSSKADTLIGNNGPLLFQPKSAVEEREHQQRQAERIAREWATTFDAVQEAIWILDLDQRVVRANAAAEKAFGCPLAEMIGRRCFDILHHTDGPIPGCPFCSMRVSRQRESFEMRVGERWFNVTTDPLLDERDNLIGAVHIARDITERKRAEQALRESDRRLATLLANLPGMAYRCQNRPDWPMEFVSDGCAGLTGWPASALLENRPAYGELIVEADRQSVWDAVQQALAAKRPFEITYRIRTANGQLRWMWERGCGVFAPDGTLLCLEGFITDITARVHAEEALRRERALLERITTYSPVGITVVNRHGQIIFANAQAEKILGLTNEAITRRTYNDPAWHITDLDGGPFPDEELPFRRVITTRQSVTDVRHAIEWPDGRRVLLSINGAPLFDAAGELEGAVFTVSDITEQLQAEAALRESEARFRRLFENSLVGIYRTTPDGRILLANPTLVKMLRYPSFEALAQQNLEKYGFHPQYPRRLFKEAIERDGVVRGLESAWTCADGTTVYVRESAQAVRGPDGRVAYYEGVVEDITEQRGLEERVHHASKMETIGRLAGGVAHDFNNILSVVIMQTDLMAMEEGLSNTAKEGLRQIRAAAERAANLTRQLLMFSRRQAMQPRDLDLNDTVTNLTKMLQRIIGEDVHLELRLHPTPLMTRADVSMLDQVLMNLAVNARDAMPKGGRLTIETTAREFAPAEAATLPDVQPGRYVGLRVSDTGCGIPPEILPHIFEPFFTTKEPGKGTGLGLATVFGIVKQHSGCVRVASEPNRGTTFEIYLPALPETAVAEATKVEAVPSPRGGTETILLVEDDPAVRLLTQTTLQRHGYRVLEAADSITALALWQTHRNAVALLLTDMVMPGGLNGLELARRLRADRPELKVIFTSGYSAELARGILNHEEGDAFLQKPCEATHLLETVRRCLDAPPAAPPH